MRGLLEEMFSLEEPLGPYVTPTPLFRNRNRKTFSLVFDAHNFLSRETIARHPNIIMGRRGAGKTAFLIHTRFAGGYGFATRIETENAFADVASQICRIFDRRTSADALVENVARVWRSVVLTAAMLSFHSSYASDARLREREELAEVRRFLEKAGMLSLRSPRSILRVLLKTYEETRQRNYDFVWDFLEGTFSGEIGFVGAWEAMTDLMREEGLRGVVLIDSLEQFPIAQSEMCEALAGLLHFVGELDREFTPLDVTLCLPSELHEDFGRISDNVEKDFEKVLLLHWDPVELFQMCGHRFSLFLKIHERRFDKRYELLSDRPTREEVWRFWYQFLPRTMRNRYGLEEDSISYVSRHTQLLPRHFLNILNKIAMISIASRSNVVDFDEDDIIRGVRLGEGVICEGILNGFKQKWPMARDVCKMLLPNLPNLFDYRTLQRVNRDHGKGLVRDAHDVLEILVRMGIVGRLDTSGVVYDECRFDYTYNGSMPYSTEDRFGVHPAFSGQFGNGGPMRDDGAGRKPIYPTESFTGQRRGVGALTV